MWYKKDTGQIISSLPRKIPGVSNFHKLSPADLHSHGFVEVTDAKPSFDPKTQRLVKGEFNEVTTLQKWVVEPIPAVDLNPAKTAKMQALQAEAASIALQVFFVDADTVGLIANLVKAIEGDATALAAAKTELAKLSGATQIKARMEQLATIVQGATDQSVIDSAVLVPQPVVSDDVVFESSTGGLT